MSKTIGPLSFTHTIIPQVEADSIYSNGMKSCIAIYEIKLGNRLSERQVASAISNL